MKRILRKITGPIYVLCLTLIIDVLEFIADFIFTMCICPIRWLKKKTNEFFGS